MSHHSYKLDKNKSENGYKKRSLIAFVFWVQGIVKVGAVDADQHNSMGGQYGVRGFPTIKIFGANKNKPEDYQGSVLHFHQTSCIHVKKMFYGHMKACC